MPPNLCSSLLWASGCQIKCRNSFKKGSEDVGAPQEAETLCLLSQTQSHLKYWGAAKLWHTESHKPLVTRSYWQLPSSLCPAILWRLSFCGTEINTPHTAMRWAWGLGHWITGKVRKGNAGSRVTHREQAQPPRSWNMEWKRGARNTKPSGACRREPGLWSLHTKAGAADGSLPSPRVARLMSSAPCQTLTNTASAPNRQSVNTKALLYHHNIVPNCTGNTPSREAF